MQVLKEARQRYEMRWKSQGRTSKYQDTQRRKRHEILMQRHQAYQREKESIVTSYAAEQQPQLRFDENNEDSGGHTNAPPTRSQ